MGLRSKLKNKAKNVLRRLIDRYVAEDIPSPEPPPPQRDQPSSTPKKEEPTAKATPSAVEKAQEEPTVQEDAVATSTEENVDKIEDTAPQQEATPPQEEQESAPPEEEVVQEEPPEVTLKEHEVKPTLAPLSEEEKKEQAKAKHMKKTKRGLLKKLKESGGDMPLRDLHDYSEKRFFMGHQKFSLLMEELVEEDLVEYSYEDRTVSLGEKAEEFLRT